MNFLYRRLLEYLQELCSRSCWHSAFFGSRIILLNLHHSDILEISQTLGAAHRRSAKVRSFAHEPDPADPQAVRVRIPLSLGARRNDLDKGGDPCVVYDVVFNNEVIEQVTKTAPSSRKRAASAKRKSRTVQWSPSRRHSSGAAEQGPQGLPHRAGDVVDHGEGGRRS